MLTDADSKMSRHRLRDRLRGPAIRWHGRTAISEMMPWKAYGKWRTRSSRRCGPICRRCRRWKRETT